MYVDECGQAFEKLERKLGEQKMVKEGMELWRKQQEYARYKKLHEQKQARDMMERHWPWGQHRDLKPRGLRNLRLEEIFPHGDYQKAKRFVGSLEMGRPGGGAPNVNESGRRVVRTREDPALRFQWGKDLRKCVDNTLRYRKGKEEQEQYRKELDRLVDDKIKRLEQERTESLRKDRELSLMASPWGRPGPGGVLWRHPGAIGFGFLNSLGWTNKDTLKKLEKDKENYHRKLNKGLDNFKKMTLCPPNQISFKHDKSKKYWCDYGYNSKGPNQAILRRTQLSPLRDGKDNGVELVPLMVAKRSHLKIPLGTTDVTRHGNCPIVSSKYAEPGNIYLQELSKQMEYKERHMQNLRNQEMTRAINHFEALDSFWGRPGHGAPRSAIKKGCIEKMLFPRMMPIPVS